MQVFLSYRRDDAAGHAGRLTDALEAVLGDDAVFQDVEAIAPGKDFIAEIDAALARSQALLVVIGPRWLDARDAGGERRLDDPQDFVRLEITRALERGIRVLPVLVGGAKMPGLADLPAVLQPLARLQAFELSDARWSYDTDRILSALGAKRPAPPGRRRVLRIAAIVLAIDAAAIGAWLLLRDRPDVGGTWRLPSGSTWVITRQGDALAIEETHYESREVWKRGTGRISGHMLEYELRYVFERDARERGRVDLSDDGRVLRGEAEQLPGGRREPITLTR